MLMQQSRFGSHGSQRRVLFRCIPAGWFAARQEGLGAADSGAFSPGSHGLVGDAPSAYVGARLIQSWHSKAVVASLHSVGQGMARQERCGSAWQYVGDQGMAGQDRYAIVRFVCASCRGTLRQDRLGSHVGAQCGAFVFGSRGGAWPVGSELG